MELYSKHDLIFMPIWLAVIADICAALYFTLRNRSERARTMPFYVLAIAIVLIEILKQIITLSKGGGYDKWALPFHTCSIFIFALPLAVFLPPRSFASRVFWNLSVGLGAGETLMLLVWPSMILGSANKDFIEISGMSKLLEIHAITFHVFILTIWVVLAFLFRPYKPRDKWRETLGASAVMLLFSVIGAVAARVFGENYAKFIRFEDIGIEGFYTKYPALYVITIILFYTVLLFVFSLCAVKLLKVIEKRVRKRAEE